MAQCDTLEAVLRGVNHNKVIGNYYLASGADLSAARRFLSERAGAYRSATTDELIRATRAQSGNLGLFTILDELVVPVPIVDGGIILPSFENVISSNEPFIQRDGHKLDIRTGDIWGSSRIQTNRLYELLLLNKAWNPLVAGKFRQTLTQCHGWDLAVDGYKATGTRKLDDGVTSTYEVTYNPSLPLQPQHFMLEYNIHLNNRRLSLNVDLTYSPRGRVYEGRLSIDQNFGDDGKGNVSIVKISFDHTGSVRNQPEISSTYDPNDRPGAELLLQWLGLDSESSDRMPKSHLDFAGTLKALARAVSHQGYDYNALENIKAIQLKA